MAPLATCSGALFFPGFVVQLKERREGGLRLDADYGVAQHADVLEDAAGELASLLLLGDRPGGLDAPQHGGQRIGVLGLLRRRRQRT